MQKKVTPIKTEAIAKAIKQTSIPQSFVGMLADEVAKTVVKRLPNMIKLTSIKRKKQKSKKIDHSIFLDTSAIIDGRVFDVIKLGVFNGTFLVLEGVLLELKHIADSQDMVRRERGRKGLEYLENIKKTKGVKTQVIDIQPKDGKKPKEVDEQLIAAAKDHKGKIITCDYNLEKKASVNGVTAININALAQCVKVSAVPGESLHIKLLHTGKDATQGIGYLDDGTMIVVEHASELVGTTADVVVSRVIQTASGRILFAKRIS